MAGGDEFLGSGNARGAMTALLVLGAGTNVYDAFSAVMSSPWSTEKFSEDESADRMANEYVCHALVISGGYAALGAYLSRNLAPLLGALGVAVYMTWLYMRALRRAKAKRPAGQVFDNAW